MTYAPQHHQLALIAAENEGYIAAINRQPGDVPSEHRPLADLWIKGFVAGQCHLARAAREMRI